MKTNTIETILLPHESELAEMTFAEQVLRRVNALVERDLERVITSEKNIDASHGGRFGHPFGRDTAITADRLLLYDEAVARQAIKLLFTNQGVANNATTGEKPGKIFHELKQRGDDPAEQKVFDSLHFSTGIGDDETYLSFTSVDATPEAIHLVARYAERYGRHILDEEVERQGETVRIEQCFDDAVGWVRANIARSDIGLICTVRTNPRSVIVADLLDGATSFMHADGTTLINYHDEVNTINFQALGYQALMDAAELAEAADKKQALFAEAVRLQALAVDYFWMPDKQRVAMAIDRDANGQPRRLETETILPAVALRTGIFDNRPDIIEAIFKGLYTSDMMTCVGPRTQTAAMDVGYIRYQEPPWPVLVGRVVDGAMRYGQDAIAVDLIERMLMGIYTTGKSEEFHQVTKHNELGILSEETAATILLATDVPQAPQAWTAATVWAMTHEVLPVLHEWSEQPRTTTQILTSEQLQLNKLLQTIAYRPDQARAKLIEDMFLEKGNLKEAPKSSS